MPRSFLVKSKKAHSYHQPRSLEESYNRLDTSLAHICAGISFTNIFVFFNCFLACFFVGVVLFCLLVFFCFVLYPK